MSVLEQISVNVLATLQGVTTGNGYAVTLDAMRARQINDPRHLRAIIYQLSPDEDDDATPVGATGWMQPYAVVVYVMPLDDDATPIDTYNNQIVTALTKALCVDPTRGGHAIDTIVRPPLYFPPVAGETAGVTMMFDVRYRHRIDRPDLAA